MGMTTHSQKELARWAVDVSVEFYACLFSRKLSEMMMNSGMSQSF